MKLYVIVNEKKQFFAGIGIVTQQPIWCSMYYGRASVDIFSNKDLADAWAYELTNNYNVAASVEEFVLCH